MDNNIQDPNNQAVTQQVEAPFDPKTVQPAVIGELRKDRIGKPILVLEMLVMFGIVMVALPLVYTIANDEKSVVYKWLHKDEVIVEEPSNTETKYLDGSVLQLLESSTNMKYNGIVIQAFKLNESTINCRIFSLNEKIDFDEEEYYLEIYSNSQEKIAAIKLSGVYDFTPKDTVLTAGGLTFNSNFKYFGKMVKMTDASYPEVKYEKNAQEIGSFTCTNKNHIIKYTFKNDYLLSIDETYKFVKSDYDDSTYLELYSEYQTKSKNLGSNVSSTEEDADGFTFKASLDLEHDYKIPETVTDNNYYEKDSKAKVIHYAETGKGFDCK
jgi:hypothetical protein